ncbi:3-oxoadipyl-CoA thiolase [Alteromonas gilva]|uniref:acetyl-CoA C-acyltransferase n=1 Tax=Alteromonas gilva TaxID=2987522 RepID=A0ABT5L0Y8_9ALTE|nr:3-oxoadipyl-CoA thiolase [Alteromonas gilva]MDC8830141.1 3-oxoadipyl-CoA thiolase [Alteromonas gilva]
MQHAYIYDGLRTAFGRHGGALAHTRPDDLLALCLKGLLSRQDMPLETIEDVVIGCTNQAGEDARNVARHAALLAGLPVTVAAQTQNRLCGSGLSAAIEASRAIACNEGEWLIAGGVESMSRAPFVMAKNSQPFGRDISVFDSTIGARFPNPQISANFGDDTMPQTADNIAHELNISRQQSDTFALASQHKYQRANSHGFFADEILPVSVATAKRRVMSEMTKDEHPRADSSAEKLASLSPLFTGGVVTAGNASGINDGAAALLLGSLAAGDKLGISPRARIVASAVAGVEPRVMGLGPVYAIRKALKRAKLSLDDMDIIEINEAFAVQVLGCLQLLGISFDDARVNPNGGAIAVGHPLGASGIRLLLTALRQLEASQGRFAVVSLCIGVGQGVAMVIERV